MNDEEINNSFNGTFECSKRVDNILDLNFILSMKEICLYIVPEVRWK